MQSQLFFVIGFLFGALIGLFFGYGIGQKDEKMFRVQSVVSKRIG